MTPRALSFKPALFTVSQHAFGNAGQQMNYFSIQVKMFITLTGSNQTIIFLLAFSTMHYRLHKKYGVPQQRFIKGKAKLCLYFYDLQAVAINMACKQTRFHLKQITTGTDSLKKKQGIAAYRRISWVGTVYTRKGVKEVVLFAGNTCVLRFNHILAPLNVSRLSTCLQSLTHYSIWLVLMKRSRHFPHIATELSCKIVGK